MRRLPAIAFGLLAVATVGAFFLTQHLKGSNPLVWGTPEPVPRAIDPISGRPCPSSKGKLLHYREAGLPIAVSRTGSVGVWIVRAANPTGAPVATISSGTPMARSVFGSKKLWYPKTFVWDGRFSGGTVAPDGTYFFRIALFGQGRTINLTHATVQVITKRPRARILAVRLTGAAQTGELSSAQGPPVLTPPHGDVKIDYTRGHYRRVWIDVYRKMAGRPRRVGHVVANPRGSSAIWDGTIGGLAAPPGAYMFGITAQNLACDQASWRPATAGSTADRHSAPEVTIRYLSATARSGHVRLGARARIDVDSPVGPFHWTLRRRGSAKALARGNGAAGVTSFEMRLPRRRGPYVLVVRSGSRTAEVRLTVG